MGRGVVAGSMARVLFLLADGFDDRDYKGLRGALEGEGHEVVPVGAERGATVTGSGGLEVQTERDPLHLDLNAYHVVVVPGGAGADRLVENSQMVNVVYSMAHKGRWLVLVGRGVRLLPPVGKQKSPNPIATGNRVLDSDLIKGRLVTGDPEVREELEKGGARWGGGPVRMDGVVASARSGHGGDLERLMEELAPALALAQRPVVSRIL